MRLNQDVMPEMRLTPLIPLVALLLASCAEVQPRDAAFAPSGPMGQSSQRTSDSQAQKLSTAPVTERGYRVSLQRWVGRPVSEVVAEWGQPEAIYEANRYVQKRYLWLRNVQQVELQGEQVPGSCATRLVVDAAGVVVSFFYDGNTCKAADRSSYSGAPTFSIVGSSRHVENSTTIEWYSVLDFTGVQDLPLNPGCGAIPKGRAVPASCLETELPVRAMKLRLRGMHLYHGPAEEAKVLAANGTLLSLEGEVEFEPKAGHEYVVTGTLAPGRSAVWVEDLGTKQPATAIVRE